jgi:hypothetical protein
MWMGPDGARLGARDDARMTENVPHPFVASVRSMLNWLAEAIFLVDVVVAAFLVSIVVLAGVNPFHSTALTAALVGTAVVIAFHHAWFMRHREEIAQDRAVHAMRERRGF